MGDKGYDGQGNRVAARERGICPVIPFKSSAKNRPAFFPKALYRARARIEQLVGKLKRFKRIALRCEKRTRTSDPSSPLLLASSSLNPSTRPSLVLSILSSSSAAGRLAHEVRPDMAASRLDLYSRRVSSGRARP